ncbi:unnamed protein product [Closterium sp. NIES-64]|nr:unnamed protein product [Closterium sp. NIES-64]
MPHILVALPRHASPFFSGKARHSPAAWQRKLEQLLPPHAFALRGRVAVVVVVPTREQQLAAERAWRRLQRQQGAQGGDAAGGGGALEVHVVVVGLSRLPRGLPPCALALVTAVCAPPSAAPTGSVSSLWPPSRIHALLSAPAPLVLILGHHPTLSAGSNTWRQVIGQLKAQGRFMDLEEGGGAVARAIAARREAVEEMRCMVQGARAAAAGASMGAASPHATGWHDLPWTGLFSPSFGEALQRAESVEVVLCLWRILQGRHGGRDGKPAASWLPAGPEWAEDEVPRRALNDIVHVDVVGDYCLIWSTDTSITHASCCTCIKQVVRLWALEAEGRVQQTVQRIHRHLCCYSPAYLHYCAQHQYCPSSPRLRMPALLPHHRNMQWWRTPSGGTAASCSLVPLYLCTNCTDVSDTSAGVSSSATSADVVTPPKFIALQPAVALTLLARGGGALAASLGHLPFEVNAEERAAILCPSSLVVHGRSGTGKTTVIIHRALRLHRLSSTPPLASPPAHGATGMWGTVSEGGAGDGTGVLRQVVVTRSLQLCASIQADITHASESLAALDSAHLASQPSAGLHSSTEQQQEAPQQQQPAPQVPPQPTGGGSASNSSAQRQHRHHMLLMQEDLEAFLMGSLPSCIAAIPPTAFPLALTLSKLLRLLDASVTRPFLRVTQRQRTREVARRRVVVAIEMSVHGVREAWEQEEGGRAWGGHVEKERWEARNGGAQGWGRGAGEHSRGGRREGLWDAWQQETDEEVTLGKEEEEEQEEEVEVDYERFRRQYWPHLDQRAVRGVVVDAAFVWREITSHIKGSLQALQALQQGQQGQQGQRGSSSKTGHVVVGEEEYVAGMVGSNERTSAMGERDRRAVYRLFQAYERRKRQRGEYDSADLVLHLHQEIRRMQQHGEPWWSVDHTLPAPPWAIPGSTTTTGLHRTPPASTPSAPWSASCSGPCAPVFHCVSVDEVQDLTQAQLALLPLLCGNVASGFVLAGDTAQSIAHGVDFRFEDLARVVYSEFLHKGDELGRIGGGRSGHGGSKAGHERRTGRENAEACSSSSSSSSNSKVGGEAGMKALPTFQLVRNYRTHRGIIRVATTVVRLLTAFFPAAIDRLHAETSVVDGAVPVMASVLPEWKMHLARGMPLSATQAIIVRSSEEKRRLLALFAAKPVVLTVEECKGLEFQDVILFNFFTSPQSTTPWALLYTYMHDAGLPLAAFSHCTCAATSSRSINQGCSCGKGQQQLLQFNELKHCALCAELKQLYVAVTRAKQRLWVLDEEATPGDRDGHGDSDGCSRAWGVRSSAPMRDLWHALGVVAVRPGSEVTPESVKREPDEDDWHSLAFTVSLLFCPLNLFWALSCFAQFGLAYLLCCILPSPTHPHSLSLCLNLTSPLPVVQFFQRGDYEAAQASYERAGDTDSARFAHTMLLYNTALARMHPHPHPLAVMPSLPPSSQEHAPEPLLLPAVPPDLLERSPSELLLEAARTFEEIGRNAEAGRAYVKARNYVEAVRVYLHACRPPKHMDAARCYQKLGQFAEAADCYSAGGDMHSALLVCLRARIFQKGLSLLDIWQAPASTSAAAVQEAQRVKQLRGWYLVECARWHERQREYDHMLSFIRLHHCLPTKRAFLEAGRHLRQLAALEDEQGDKSRVPGLLERAGALIEAAWYLWQQGSPGRALVYFVRHLHCRLNAAGRGALRVGVRKRAGERGRGGGGGEMSEEEVEMAGRLWAVERWSFAERDACGASDLAWARVEMSVLLLLMAHDIAIVTHTDTDIDSDDAAAAAAAAAVRGDDGDTCQGAMGARVGGEGAAVGGEAARVRDVEWEACLSRAWMAVRQGQAVPAELVGKCTGAAGAEAGNGGGGRGGEGGRDGASGGIAVWWADVRVREEERGEAEDMWQGRDVLRKGREQMEREKKRGVTGGLGMEEMVSEWKGAEQVRAEMLLASAGVQVSMRMLQCAQDHLSSWLAHFHSALPSSSHHVCSPQPATPSTAATPASPSASPTAASAASAARVVAAPAEEAAARQVGQEPCMPPPPPIGPLQQKLALWFYRWLSRLSALLSALRHLLALPAAGPHLPRLHAAVSLLSCSFHCPKLTSCCHVDDVSLPWVPRGDVQRVASSGASGEMERWRAVEMVESAWEREYVARWRAAQHVARTGGVDCSSCLLSCLQQSGACRSGACQSGACQSGACQSGACQSGACQSGACQSGACQSGACRSGACQSGACQSGACQSGACQSGACQSGACQSAHASATTRTPVAAHAPPSPHAALLSFLPLIEHSLSLLPVTMFSCSRSAILPSRTATPLHHLFSSLLLHPLPTNRASPPTRDDHKPARPCWPHHMCHTLLHPTLAALLLHDLPAQGQAARAYDSSKAGGSRLGYGLGAGEMSRGEGRGSDAHAGEVNHGPFALGRAEQAAAHGSVPAGQSCWQGEVNVTAEDAWGITLLFLTCMLNPHPHSCRSRDKDWGLMELEARMRVACERGNPLMAPSIAGFTHALSARALLHQASPLPNVHGDSGRLLHFPWKASLLPLAPTLAPVPAIPLLPHPPAAIFNVSPPLANVLFDLLSHLLPTLLAMRARGEGVTGGPGRMGRSECGEGMYPWELMHAFEEFGMGMVEIAPSQFQAFWKRFPNTIGRSGKV